MSSPIRLSRKHGLYRFWFPALALLTIATTALTAASFLSPDVPTRYVRYSDYWLEPPSSPALAQVRTIDAAYRYVRRARRSPADVDTAAAIDDFVRQRFSHTYSTYSFHEDWLAYLAGFVWADLANPVAPDHIMREAVAGCSQQSMVVQALLARFGIDYTSVGFRAPYHFASAARLGGRWYVIDTDLYPDNAAPIPLASIMDGSATASVYHEPFASAAALAGKEGRVWTMHRSEYPAPHAIVFHRVTGFLSHYGFLVLWAVCGLVAVARRGSTRRLRSSSEASAIADTALPTPPAAARDRRGGG